MRNCARCKKPKPSNHFYENRKTCLDCRKKRKQRYYANLERESANKKAWRKQNAEKEKARKKLQKYTRRKALGFFSKLQLEWRMNYFHNRCWICDTSEAITIDHVKPLSKGGSNWPSNLRACCSACNTIKSNYWPNAPTMKLRLMKIREKVLKRNSF